MKVNNWLAFSIFSMNMKTFLHQNRMCRLNWVKKKIKIKKKERELNGLLNWFLNWSFYFGVKYDKFWGILPLYTVKKPCYSRSWYFILILRRILSTISYAVFLQSHVIHHYITISQILWFCWWGLNWQTYYTSLTQPWNPTQLAMMLSYTREENPRPPVWFFCFFVSLHIVLKLSSIAQICFGIPASFPSVVSSGVLLFLFFSLKAIEVFASPQCLSYKELFYLVIMCALLRRIQKHKHSRLPSNFTLSILWCSPSITV